MNCLQFLAIAKKKKKERKNKTQNWYKLWYEHNFSFLLGKYPGVGKMGEKLSTSLIL